LKTVAEKLLIKPGTTVWLSDPGRRALIEPLPDGVADAAGPDDAATALVFADDAESLRAVLERHGAGLSAPAVVWIAYPKGGRSDVSRNTLWPILGEYGMRPIGQVAIDDTWSALRFRPLEPGETFSGPR
jgi:hypothetical protein